MMSFGKCDIILLRIQIRRDYASIGDYILIEKLAHERRKRADGKLEAERDCTNLRVAFVLNDFPYHIEEGIEHHVSVILL